MHDIRTACAETQAELYLTALRALVAETVAALRHQGVTEEQMSKLPALARAKEMVK